MNMNVNVRDALLPAALYRPSDIFPTNAARVKRAMDIVLCLIALPLVLLICVPIMLLVMLDGGSAFFSQKRIGRGGKKFHCLKFRTMVPDAQSRLQRLLENDPESRAEWARDFKLKSDPRVTLIGHFLRKTSLDEVPQILNVLRGEMSIVGPRPVTREELSLYGDNAGLYLACAPGITGLWQVSGRNDVSYARRVAMDVRYVLTWSPWLDIKIMLRTLPVMIQRKGAY